jgi:glycopeptide antibiotics resistance protein
VAASITSRIHTAALKKRPFSLFVEVCGGRQLSNHRASHARAWIVFGLWLAVILAATVAVRDFVGHTHWQKVQWIPFRSPPVKILDVVVNIALYLPFGYTLARALAHRARGWHAVVLAGALSLTIEWSQLYSHSRFPSLQDVLCDVLGAWVGARLATPRDGVSR